MNRLGADGVLNDTGWSRPQIAMDALRPLVLGADKALAASRAEREAAEHSPLAKAVPGYGRLR